MKLSMKLWIYFIISSIVAIILFVVLTLTLGKIMHNGYTYETITVMANELITDVKQTGVKETALIPIMETVQSKHPSVEFEWLDAEGKILYASGGRTNPYNFTDLIQLLTKESEGYWTPDEPVDKMYPADISGQTYYLHLVVPPEEMKDSQFLVYFRTWTSLLSLVIPFLVFISTPYFFTYGFFRSIRKRLKKINQALSDMSLDHRQEIRDDAKDEIGQLARHFNGMSKRIHQQVVQIQDQETKRKNLISNLSHDLRTPLTNILGYAQTIKKGIYKNTDELQAHTEVILSRSEYMEKLINTLFQASQYDLQGVQIQKKPTQIVKIFRKVLAEYISVLEAKEIVTELSIPDISITLMVDAHLMERVIRNLLENAIKYGADGQYLGVEYMEGETQVSFSVIDRGKGVPPDQQSHLFDRFYQGSQNRSSEGFGIGLSIVKEIVLAHSGEISVYSEPGQETRFTVTLPRQTAL